VSAGILDGVRVVDLAQGLAGSVAAMVLAEAGAEVVRIEPPGGDPMRGAPPFAVWNRSKSSVALDAFGAGRDQLERLVRGADVLIHDYPPGEARAKGLDDASLKRLAPGLIVAAVTGFPEGHDDDETPADDVLVLAKSGIMDEQGAVRRDGPIYVRFPLGSWGAVWLAAIGIATRIYNERRGGGVGAVRTSLFQGALVPVLMLWRRVEKNAGPMLTIGMPKGGKVTMAECQDGVWLHLMRNPDLAPLMQQVLGELDPADVAKANEGNTNPAYPSWGANLLAFKRRPSTEWLPDLWASDVAVQPALPMGQLYYDEQSQANGYVVPVDDPVFGRTQQPGSPYTTTPPPEIRGPAPVLDSGREALERWEPRPARPASRTFKRPLEGLKVVDFGNFLAGPLAPMLMADMGADVVKLEATTGDMMRPTEFAFYGCQRNKRGIAVDMKNPASRPIVERLVRQADAVHHNLRMPAAKKLGIDYETLHALNPRLVYSHVSSYGPIGPRKDWPGFDQLFQASSGWEYEGAGEGNQPIWHRFGMMDHQAAMSSLYALMLGLIERERTGEGQFVAASLLGASILTTSETLVLPNGELAPYPQLDSMQMGVAENRRIYPTADGWLALSTDARGLAKLAEAIGAARGESLEGPLSRMTLKAALEAARLSDAPAAPVRLDQADAFFDNPANRRIKLAAHTDHPVHGRFDQPGAFWTFEGQDLAFDRCSPTLGQHTAEIMGELGFSSGEVQALAAKGAILLG